MWLWFSNLFVSIITLVYGIVALLHPTQQKNMGILSISCAGVFVVLFLFMVRMTLFENVPRKTESCAWVIFFFMVIVMSFQLLAYLWKSPFDETESNSWQHQAIVNTTAASLSIVTLFVNLVLLWNDHEIIGKLPHRNSEEISPYES